MGAMPQQQMLSQTNSGRCWASGLLSKTDAGRGCADGESRSKWTGTAVGRCTHSFRGHRGRPDLGTLDPLCVGPPAGSRRLRPPV
eukprot:6217121-Pyramimonas_sp.AAC.1